MPKCTTPCLASHSVAATFTPQLSVAYSLRGKVRSWWPVQSRTVPPLGTGVPACFTAASRSDDAIFQRIFVHRLAAFVEVPGRVDVGAGVVGHRDEHRRKPVHVAGFGERVFVGLPDAVDDGGMARIARGAVVELTAEIHDLHDWYPLRRDSADGCWTGAKCWRISGPPARQPPSGECCHGLLRKRAGDNQDQGCDGTTCARTRPNVPPASKFPRQMTVFLQHNRRR